MHLSSLRSVLVSFPFLQAATISRGDSPVSTTAQLAGHPTRSQPSTRRSYLRLLQAAFAPAYTDWTLELQSRFILQFLREMRWDALLAQLSGLCQLRLQSLPENCYSHHGYAVEFLWSCYPRGLTNPVATAAVASTATGFVDRQPLTCLYPRSMRLQLTRFTWKPVLTQLIYQSVSTMRNVSHWNISYRKSPAELPLMESPRIHYQLLLQTIPFLL